jgi:hypothetical protein
LSESLYLKSWMGYTGRFLLNRLHICCFRNEFEICKQQNILTHRIKTFFSFSEQRNVLIKIQNYPVAVILLETLKHIEFFVSNPDLTIQ